MILSSLGFLYLAPKAKNAAAFYKGSIKEKEPNFWLLTSSLVISWLFAKSITNAADLGMAFGAVGGLAYAAYYLSFLVAGIIIYQLRTKGNFTSIHHFLESKYGKGAIVIFSILIAFRLFNEVWSNTMVIGSYFGEGLTYFAAIIIFTLLTLAYSLKGGMSSSIITDVIQMIFFGILLSILLFTIIPNTKGGVSTYVQSGDWVWAGGLNLLFVAIIQSLSYPFHDPVMTDRGFISSPKVTLKSFAWASVIGGLCIFLFSFIGIYGQIENSGSPVTVNVAQSFNIGILLLMNFIMITSAASTLDSTFSSFAKLIQLDILQKETPSISAGRWSMAAITILGTIPIFFGAKILSATTVSGTMVIGLAPIFLFWNWKAPRISFYLSVFIGLFFGIGFVWKWFPENWFFTDGKYADLLFVNILGTICCFLGFLLPYWTCKYILFSNNIDTEIIEHE